MDVLPKSETKTEFSIHPDTKIGSVSLTVASSLSERIIGKSSDRLQV
jgi:hypothetical protein